MGRATETVALAVEVPAAGIAVVRVAGTLDRMTAPRLARLLDNQLERCLAVTRDGPLPTGDGRAHLVVDLECVHYFGTGGFSVLRHAQYTAHQADVGFLLTGLTARAGLLPGWAAQLVPEFEGYPTLETALARILDAGPPPPDEPPARPRAATTVSLPEQRRRARTSRTCTPTTAALGATPRPTRPAASQT